MSDLRHKQSWSGVSPEGLAYEISHWGVDSMCDGAGMWNYYIIIPKDQLRPEDWARVWLPVASTWNRSSGHAEPTYNEYESILSDGDFHGGITFYEKNAQVDGTRRSIKVGCDYGHAFDRDTGYSYDLSDVQRDALNTCRKLAEILNPLVRCSWSGMYFDARFDVSGNVPGWRGGYLSPAGLGSKTMWKRRDAERVRA